MYRLFIFILKFTCKIISLSGWDQKNQSSPSEEALTRCSKDSARKRTVISPDDDDDEDLEDADADK